MQMGENEIDKRIIESKLEGVTKAKTDGWDR
jgi:hypothetical protein